MLTPWPGVHAFPRGARPLARIFLQAEFRELTGTTLALAGSPQLTWKDLAMSTLTGQRVGRRIMTLGSSVVPTIRGIAVLLLLLWPWQGLAEGFTRFFRATWNIALSGVEINGVPLQLVAPPVGTATGALHEWRVAFSLPDIVDGSIHHPWLNLKVIVYLPLVVFLALASGTPMRSARVWGLTFGCSAALIGGFIVTTFAIATVSMFGAANIQALQLNAGLRRTLWALLTGIYSGNVGIAAMLWYAARSLAVAITRTDAQR